MTFELPPPPGPKGPGWGLLNRQAWQSDECGFLAMLTEQYGDIVGFDLGGTPTILVHGAPHVRQLLFGFEAVLRKPGFVKDSNRGYWGDGLTTLEWPEWRERRVRLQPLFRAGPVTERLSAAAACAADMVAAWPDHGAIDLARAIRILTARIAVRTVLDAELEGYGTGDGRSGVVPFAEAFGEDYVSAPAGGPGPQLVMVRPRAPRRMDGVIGIIDRRLAGAPGGSDVLSDLVRMASCDGTGLTRNDIVGEVIQMLYAGHLTIPFCLMNFWRDIHVHGLDARIAAEADHLCTTDALQPEALSQSYCQAVLMESMRLEPPAPVLYREVATAFELGGFAFAAGTSVWVSPWLLHRDARGFPVPDRFIPERFLIPRQAATADAIHIPFGAGPRVCIANRLALYQMAIIALLVARRFKLAPSAENASEFRLQIRTRA